MRRLKPLAPPAVQRLARTHNIRSRARRDATRFFNSKMPPILVYQMGKVGSTTLVRALKGSPLPNLTLHLHTLNYVDHDLKARREAGAYPIPLHLEIARQLIARRSEMARRACKIISLVRDPIAREISAAFEVPFWYGLAPDVLAQPDRAIEILERRLSHPSAFDHALGWFDQELKCSFGIDVFAAPFALDRGWAVYHHGDFEALVIRTEDLTRVGPEIIAEFVGLPGPLSLSFERARVDTPLGESYHQVLASFRPSAELVDRVYNSRLVRHFYSDALISAFVRHWRRPLN